MFDSTSIEYPECKYRLMLICYPVSSKRVQRELHPQENGPTPQQITSQKIAAWFNSPRVNFPLTNWIL